MSVNFLKYLESGGFKGNYLFHISGMPWIATNSETLKTWLNNTSGDTLLRKVVGVNNGTSSTLSTADVTAINILDTNLGTQEVSYKEDKGLNVGSWSVKLLAETGEYPQWDNGGTFGGNGVLGINWQPDQNTTGTASALLAKDIVPTDTLVSKITMKNTGGGNPLYQWLMDNTNTTHTAYTKDCYLWCGSSCYLAKTVPVLSSSSNLFSLYVYTNVNRTPGEFITANIDDIYATVTNYPQGIAGMTATLWVVPNVSDDPILLRVGKIKPNLQDKGNGLWQVTIGGFTEQLSKSFKNPPFSASLRGFHFGQGTNSEYEVYKTPDAMLYSVYTNGDITYDKISLTNAAAKYISYFNKEDLLDALLTQLNDLGKMTFGKGSLNTNQGANLPDILVEDYEDTTHGKLDYCKLGGTLPFILGLGYLQLARGGEYHDLQVLFYDFLNHKAKAFSFYADSKNPPCYPGYNKSSLTGITKNKLESDLRFPVLAGVSGNSDYYNLEDNDLKNRISCEYYYQGDMARIERIFQCYDPNPDRNQPLPMAVDPVVHATKRLFMEPDGGVVPLVGDVISIGSDDKVIDGLVVDTSGLDTDTHYVYVKFNGSTTPLTKPKQPLYNVKNGSVTFYSPLGLYQALADLDYYKRCTELSSIGSTNDAGISENTKTYMGDGVDFASYGAMADGYDYFKVGMISQVKTTNPVDLFKAMLGDTTNNLVNRNIPNNSVVDTGVGYRDTTTAKELIDWSTLEALWEVKKIPNEQAWLTKSKEDKDSKFNFVSLLNSFCLIHNIAMGWKYDATKYAWVLTFVPNEDMSLNNIQQNGLTISAGSIINGTQRSVVGESWYFAELSATIGLINDGVNVLNDVTTATYNFVTNNSRTEAALQGKKLTIKDEVTHIPFMLDQHNPLVMSLSHSATKWSRVYHKHIFSTTLASMCRTGVGLGTMYVSDYSLNRSTGLRDKELRCARVSKTIIDLGIKPKVTYNTLEYPANAKSISGSLLIAANDMTLHTGTTYKISNINTTVANNNFTDPLGHFTDLAMFGCFDFDPVLGIVKDRDCSCGDYAVTLFRTDTRKLQFDEDYSNYKQSVWKGTISVPLTSLTLGEVFLTLDGVNKLDLTKPMALIFSDYKDSRLQPCQKKFFGWLGDGHNQIEDSDSVKHAAIKLV